MSLGATGNRVHGGYDEAEERGPLWYEDSGACANLRGKLHCDYPLGRKGTWFAVGGDVKWLYEPCDVDDLANFLSIVPHDVSIYTIGVGSNTLIRDGGLLGVAIRLGRGFRYVRSDISEDGTGFSIVAGAGSLQRHVAIFAANHGIAGLGFMRGIPGSVGGGVKMNAGAYGSEFRDVLVYAEVLDRSGKLSRLTAQQLEMRYRHSALNEDQIVVSAKFSGHSGDKKALQDELKSIVDRRKQTQPINERTGGSTFRNPVGHKAWQLIDSAGGRGLIRGSAQVSTMHCNFLVQRGEGRADDIEILGERVQQLVQTAHGVSLEWEVKRIGTRTGCVQVSDTEILSSDGMRK